LLTYKHLLLAALAILFYSVPGSAQGDDEHSLALKSLTGLRNVVVTVEISSMDAFPDDPTERDLQATVEKRLREAGLNIRQRPWGTKDDYPTLLISFGYRNFDIFYYQYYVRASLKQTVSLARNPELILTSPTWEWVASGLVGGYGKRDEFGEVVDQFICDFRKVNPDIKGPLPDCYQPSKPLSGFEQQEEKRPTVITELDEELIRAAGLNEFAEVKSLVAKGAEINARDQADTTPLTYAVRSGNRKVGDTEVVRFLLVNGANPNANASGRLTALIYAIERGDVPTIQALLDHGADPNAATAEGYTALMAASILGNPEAVALLLKKNADPQAQTRQGQTALMLAQLSRNRIAAYDRTGGNAPYISVPEPTLLKQAQAKHDRVIQLLQSARQRTRK
jgi:hypothetical protein